MNCRYDGHVHHLGQLIYVNCRSRDHVPGVMHTNNTVHPEALHEPENNDAGLVLNDEQERHQQHQYMTDLRNMFININIISINF